MFFIGNEIINLLKARSKLSEGEQIKIEKICTDSRSVNSGDLFVAIKGENVDGHYFVKSAIEKGAAAALVEKNIDGVDWAKLLIVPSSVGALIDLAKYNVSKSHAKFIGVTGSVGKTTIKEMIRHILSTQNDKKIYASEKNLNSQIGLPICAAMMPSDTDIGVFEMGMSQAGELRKLVDIVPPEIAVISKICEVHSEFFNCEWDIAKAKSEILEAQQPPKVLIIPADSPYTDFLKQKAKNLGVKEVYTFGESVGDAKVLSVEKNSQGTKISAMFFGEFVDYVIQGANRSVILNSLAAIMAAYFASGMEILTLAQTLRSFNKVDGRGNIILKNDVTIIDDSYNAGPTSVHAAIETLSEYSGRKILVLGDMFELGYRSRYFHENLSAAIDKFKIDLVFTCGDLMKYLFDNLQESKRGGWGKNSEELIPQIRDCLQKNDVVLIKGSHSMHMDKIVKELTNVL